MATAVPRPTLGKPAPALALTRADGTHWELGHAAGRVIVVVFHRHIH